MHSYSVSFHQVLQIPMGQAWWRKIQTIGLGAHYKSNQSGTLQKLKIVSQRIICQTALTTRTAINLLNLLENYVTFDSKFSPDTWAGIPPGGKRTNNGKESFHAHFNKKFYASHLTIFIFFNEV